MKKQLLIVFLLTSIISFVNGQTEERKWSIGIFGGATQYNGDLGRGFYKSDQAFYGHGGLSVSRFISPRFDLSIQASMGETGYIENETNNYRAEMMHADFNFRFKFAKEEARLKPYLFVGVGLVTLGDKYTLVNKQNDLALPSAGFGFKFRLTPVISLTLHETFLYTNADDADGAMNNNNDAFLLHSLGLEFDLGKKKDEDMDRVSDNKDKCPATPKGVAVDVNGCPLDKDGDGIPDYLDACPDVKGVASATGCPDGDGDSVVDEKDQCPDVAGLADLAGCPDRDDDKVPDKDDKCPDVKGLIEIQGCPDRDGDGMIDSEDQCPDVKGPAITKGCPDRDGDGVYDMDDKCPDVTGVAINKGCPEVKEEVKEVFRKALQGIQFETGKDLIRKSSNSLLDQVAIIMIENPAYKLNINGHTDNVGKSISNLTLSQKRAAAVKKYLTGKGVEDARMTAEGFGDTKPVADNKTAEGKTQNRRVEFVVEF